MNHLTNEKGKLQENIRQFEEAQSRNSAKEEQRIHEVNQMQRQCISCDLSQYQTKKHSRMNLNR